MRIGFDAKRAFCNATGLGKYSRTLINALIETGKHDIHLYSPKAQLDFSPKTSIHMNKGILPNAIWRSRLGSKLKEDKIELYHGLSHELPTNLPHDIKAVVTIHDLIYLTRPQEFSWIDRKIYDYKFRYACERADKIVAISEQSKKDIQQFFGVSPEKIEVIYQSCHPLFKSKFFDEDIELVKENYQLPSEFIFFIGSLNPRKKPYELLEAFHQIIDLTTWDLVIVGTGEMKREMEDYIHHHALETRVHMLEIWDQEVVAKIMQACSLFAFPSVYEGFGVPVIEAHYSHVPVLTTKRSCLPEVGGPGAFYVDPDNINEFAKKLLEIIKSPDLRENSIEQSKDHLKLFDQESITNQYLSLYQQLLTK